MEFDHEIEPPDDLEEMRTTMERAQVILAHAVNGDTDNKLTDLLMEIEPTCTEMIPVLVIWAGIATHAHSHACGEDVLAFTARNEDGTLIDGELKPWEAAGEAFLNLIASGKPVEAVDKMHEWWHRSDTDGDEVANMTLQLLGSCATLITHSVMAAGGLMELEMSLMADDYRHGQEG